MGAPRQRPCLYRLPWSPSRAAPAPARLQAPCLPGLLLARARLPSGSPQRPGRRSSVRRSRPSLSVRRCRC
eukprot:8495969-Lingulodinium_polyedra.AAC.1